MSPNTRRSVLEALAIALLVLSVHRLVSLGEGFLVGSFDDDGVYTVLGKALAEGRGYHSLHLVGQPVQVKYPPGWPAVLAVIWWGTGGVEGLLRAVQWLNPTALAAATGIFWWLARRRAPWGPTLLLIVTPVVLHPVVQYTAIPLVEPWYLLGWSVALLLWERARAVQGSRPVWLTATGAVIAVTVLFRSQAVVLIPAFIVAVALLKPGWRPGLLALVAVLVPLVLWRWYLHGLIATGPVSDLPDEGTYSAWLSLDRPGAWSALTHSIVYNIRFYTMFTGGLLGPPGGAPGTVAVAILLGGMVVAGVWMFRRAPLLALGVLGSLVLVMLWPYSQDRLLLSSLPVGGLLILWALAEPLSRLATRPRRWVNLAATIAVAVVAVRQADIHRDVLTAAAGSHRPRMYTAGYQILENSRFIALRGRWLIEHTRREERVMIDRQAGIYLYTGRQAMPPSPSESRLSPSVFAAPGQYLARHILRDSIAVIVLAFPKPGIQRDIVTILAYCPGVISWGGAAPDDSPFIYRVRRDDACLTPIAAQAVAPAASR